MKRVHLFIYVAIIWFANSTAVFANGATSHFDHGSAHRFIISAPPIITASTATGNILTCAGSASASPDIQQFTVSGSALTADIVATAPAGFDLSLSANGGYGSTVTLVQLGGLVGNTVVYVRAAATAPTGNISGNVVLSSAGTANQNIAVQGAVNPLPTGNPVSSQTVVNGISTTAVNFTGSANVFSWVNDTPGIGLAASGIGDIPAFTAVNSGAAPVTATITATPISEGLAYIPNYGSNTVSVINTTTNSVIATINVGVQPQGVSVSPDGTKVYISNGRSNTVSVISTGTNKVTATIATGILPYGIAVSPDGSTVYVANTSSNSVSVINGAKNTIIATIPVAVRPVGVAISPDGSTLYVANSVSNTVSVINTGTNKVVATVSFPAGSSPWGLAITPDGSRLYVANSNSNKVSVINTLTNTIAATIAVSSLPEGIVVSPDGNRVYATGYFADAVSIISTATNTVVGTINTQQNPSGISVYPDGTRLYVTNAGSSNVSVVSTSTNLETSVVALGNNASPISLGNFIIGGTGCSGAPVKFTITVNPPPVITVSPASGSISACTGSASASPDLMQFTVSAANLFSNITATAPSGFEISLAQGSGFGNSIILTPVAGGVNTIVYVRSSALAPVGSISGNVVLTSPGLSNSIAVTCVISALPKVKAVASQFIPSGSATAAVNFTGTAGLYSWVNDTPGIGLAATGTGNIASFTAINNSAARITATITVTPMSTGANTCNGLPVTFTIVVNSPSQPGIASTGTLADLATVYGVPSTSTIFTVSGINISGGILVSPPPGFEVSTDNISFSGAVTIGASGSIAPAAVYIRLASSTPVGTYSGTIVLSSAGAADVNIAMSNGTVSPAPLTITADNQARFYKTPNPILTASYSGFVNNDGVAQLTAPLVISTTAVTLSPVGQYLILVSGAASPNYIINYVPGILTINAYQLPVIPNTFTPNNDGTNDLWEIKHLQDYQNCTIKVFTRNGSEVFTSTGYSKPWDGTYNNSPLPIGTYYYIIDLNDGSKPLSGAIAIIR